MTQVPVGREAIAGAAADGGVVALADDIAYVRLGIVNVVLVGRPGAADWMLVDAGVAGSAKLIRRAVRARFGEGARPRAIVLTHAHFDHVGALETLAAEWDVPVVAHRAEHPYLDGSASYPPPDPSVGGGLVARLSPLFPRGPVDVGRRLLAMPASGPVPHLDGFEVIETPGHSAGHVSFWRRAGRTLIAGDAVVTVAQESAYAVMTQAPELHGPPAYFTHDWQAAAISARRLAALEPELLVTGHGRALAGSAMRDALATLARDFERVAVPFEGRYPDDPHRADDGSAYRAR